MTYRLCITLIVFIISVLSRAANRRFFCVTFRDFDFLIGKEENTLRCELPTTTASRLFRNRFLCSRIYHKMARNAVICFVLGQFWFNLIARLKSSRASCTKSATRRRIDRIWSSPLTIVLFLLMVGIGYGHYGIQKRLRIWVKGPVEESFVEAHLNYLAKMHYCYSICDMSNFAQVMRD
jgi:hypothetical protein